MWIFITFTQRAICNKIMAISIIGEDGASSSLEVDSTTAEDATREYSCTEWWIDCCNGLIYFRGIIVMAAALVVFMPFLTSDSTGPNMKFPPPPAARPLPQHRTFPPTPADPCHDLARPQISFISKERKSELSYELVHYLSIDNYLDYPDELFAAVPAQSHRRSCDAGEDVSYVTIQVIKSNNGKVLAEYCEPLAQTPNVISFEATSPDRVQVAFGCDGNMIPIRSNEVEIP